MIKQFDFGWGAEWPIKQLEISIVHDYLRPLITDPNAKVVVINSTWYGSHEHEITMSWLRNNKWSHLVLVSMIDAAIAKKAWFQELGGCVIEVGYYPGSNEIVFWADVAQRYITSPEPTRNIDTAFMCLNRKPHWHRRRLFQSMQQKDLLKHGIVSMGSESNQSPQCRIEEQVMGNDLAPNGDAVNHGIPNDIASLGDHTNWQRHFLNVVTETVWDINRNHFVSEKIFKPMIGGRPFLVYDPDGATKWLTHHGFCPYVDDFKDISDFDLAEPANLVLFLEVLAQQPRSYFNKKLLDLGPKIQYNQARFQQFVNDQRIKITQGLKCQI